MERKVVTAKDGAAIPALFCNFGEGGVKGIVVVSHGFGEHAAMYSEIAQVLGQAGYATVLFDQRGHGAPVGGEVRKLGITPSYECFLDDIVSVAEAAKQMAPGVPVALYGHSMGGNIVANTLLRDGTGCICAVLEAPWMGLYKELSPLLVGFAKVAGAISPQISTTNKLKPEVLTSVTERMEGYVSDPYYHGKISFRMFSGIKKGCSYAIGNAGRLPVPVFLAYAENDMVLSNDATLQFAANAGEKVTVRGYESRHAIHNDVNREGFFRDVIGFLDSHCVTA